AGISFERGRAPGQLAWEGEPPRSARRERRYAATARAIDQSRWRAAGVVQAIRDSDGSAQSVFIRRHADVGAGFQSAPRKAEGVLSRPRVSSRVSQRTKAPAS